MLVNELNFHNVLDEIISLSPEQICLDTETTTIHWWDSTWHPRKPRVFSIQLFFIQHGKEYGYYFDFGIKDSVVPLNENHFSVLQNRLFSLPNILWFIANAKFDMHHLANHGCELIGPIHCTKVSARVLNNKEAKLSLDDLGHKYLGQEKLDIITYLKENNCKGDVQSPYDLEPKEELFFDQAPLPLLIDYGIRDVKLCYQLGVLQRHEAAVKDAEMFAVDKYLIHGKKRGIQYILDMENDLTKTLFKMERKGAKLDIDYCTKAFQHEKDKIAEWKEKLDGLATEAGMGEVLWNSNDQLQQIFDAFKIPYGHTATGKAQFTKYTLENTDHPIAKQILNYRYHYKRAYTYFKNFLELADKDGFIHPDYQPGGTVTGRFSCWNPNLQNIPKRSDKNEKDFPVRKSFVNIGDDFFLFSFDYDQMEYRLMLNYADEKKLADRIVKENLDVHQAIAEEIEKPRDDAKNINFAVLYGAGIAKIAKMIGCTQFQAGRLKKKYFQRLPGVKRFVEKVRATAKVRGYIFSIFGRVLQFTTDDHWKASNAIIQGGCADIMKTAMVQIHDLLEGKKSFMFLQVHDELCFYLHKDELFIADEINKILESAYEPKILPLTSGMAYSKNAWNDLHEGLPC